MQPVNAPQDFLAARLEALQIASDRVFRGSQRPIPELPECPGFYRHLPKNDFTLFVSVIPREITRPHMIRERLNRKNYARNTKRKCRGDILPGSVVLSGNHYGTVICFVPSGDDPMELLPKDITVTTLGGHHRHGPSAIDRYYVQVPHGGKIYHHFPKAGAIEKWVCDSSRTDTSQSIVARVAART